MENLQSHFRFSKGQRSGILFLVLLISGLLACYHLYPVKKESPFDISSSYICLLRKEIDSLRASEAIAKTPKIYPFNPNFMTDYKAYILGVPSEAFDRLNDYRRQDKWIHSAADFKRVTQVPDSVLERIQPFFKFPEWVTNPRPKKNNYTINTKKKTFSEKKDLNTASKEALMEVYGIGEVLSARIVAYREKLEGFSADIQVTNVYGLTPGTAKKVWNHFTVKSPKPIEKISLNTASASDIATIPGISFDLAKEIWEFRILRDRIEDFEELKKIEGLSSHKLQLIQLYLSLD